MALALSDISAAFHLGHMDLVIRLARKSVARDGDHGRAWELLGLAEHKRGNWTRAVDCLERASLLVPLCSLASVCLARGYARLGRRDLSHDLLVELLSNDTLTLEALLAVAVGLDAVDQPGLAMDACRRAATLDPDAANPYYDMGYYAARCGYPASVSESLARRAISLDPACVRYRVGLASFLMRQSRRQDALELVKHFSAEEITTIACRSCVRRLGELYERFGDYQRMLNCQQRHDALAYDTNADCD
jgi:tetratricopeptide (TPR) repeat protein